jgi:hypothetical protein
MSNVTRKDARTSEARVGFVALGVLASFALYISSAKNAVNDPGNAAANT